MLGAGQEATNREETKKPSPDPLRSDLENQKM